MKEITLERRERRALRRLFNGDLERAEANALKLIDLAPDNASGWAALRGALAAQGRPADAAALRAYAADPEQASGVIDCVAGRRLSKRGLIFDPADRFRVRPMADALEDVADAEALRSGQNVVWFQDRGGTLVESSPVLELDGAGGPGFAYRFHTAPKFVTSIRNAAVVGEGLVLSEDGELIAEVNPGGKPAKFQARRIGDELEFKGPVTSRGQLSVKVFDTPAFLMAGPTDTSFGDWIGNFFPRLALYEAAGLDCPILVRWKPLPQILPILEALGVSLDRLIFHTTDQISLFPKLFAPCWPSRDKGAPMADVFDIYRRAGVPAGDERPLLYLTRRGLPVRPLINEDEVCELFASRGFQIINPGGLTFEEVRRLFASAACVAGPYGSAFHNLVFSGRHPPSLALMPAHLPYHLTEIARWQTNLGNRFAYVFGETPPEGDDSYTPWTVSLDKVERALDRMMELTTRGEDKWPAEDRAPGERSPGSSTSSAERSGANHFAGSPTMDPSERAPL